MRLCNSVTTSPQGKSSPLFSAIDAKVALAQQGKTIARLAREFHLARNTVSMAIHRGLFPRVRQLIATALGLS